MYGESVDTESLIARMARRDVIIIEGLKGPSFPAAEVVRGAVSQSAFRAPETLICVAPDVLPCI